MKKKRNKVEDMKLLMGVGKKHIEPLKHAEFKCPICGGIATVYVQYDTLIVECHAENLKATQRI